jgi:hypothetical protein
MNRFCCDHLCNQGRNCPLEFKDTVPDSSEKDMLTFWEKTDSPFANPPLSAERALQRAKNLRMRSWMDQMQAAPMTSEQIAEAQRQAMNVSMNTGGDGLRNAWRDEHLHDFADTEPAPPPSSGGLWVVLTALFVTAIFILLGVWHAYR